MPSNSRLPGSGTGLKPMNSCGMPPTLWVPRTGVYKMRPLKALLGAFAASARYWASIAAAPVVVNCD